LVLLLVEATTRLLDDFRATVATVAGPVYFIARVPYKLGDAMGDVFSTREGLLRERDGLERRVLELSHVSQQFLALQAENERLRARLISRARLHREVLVAELISGMPLDRGRQVVVDKGAVDDVVTGMAVIDADGLFGQVTEVAEFTSRVLKVSDRTHAVPVQVNRNGVRAIASGDGHDLELENVPLTADIREGDLLVSSGLGGRFPKGYPVGVVVSVVNDTAVGFKQISVRPSAALDRSGHVLIVFSDPTQ